MKAKAWILTVISISIISLGGCKPDSGDTQSKSTKFVKVETAKMTSGNSEMKFNGTIKEKSMVDLSFRVGGLINSINVSEGDFVKKGQVVASLDKRDYNIQLQTNKAQYEQVKAEYERYKVLYEEGKLPANSFEKSESGYLMVKAGYENALNQINDTELKAPFSGYVFQKKAENFQTVGPGYPIVSIIDKSSFEVIIGVPENQINNVKRSDKNFVTINNAGITKLPVKILSIGEKTRSDGLYEVKLHFKNNGELNVSPGMSAEVTMNSFIESNALYIPMSAVFTSGNENFVWLYDHKSSTIKKKKVTIKGLASEGMFEITNGISAGDSVVTTGVSFLTEGQQVSPIEMPTETNIGGLL